MNERSLFLAAIEIGDAEKRAVYLRDACGGDAELLRGVEELLAASAQAGSFIDTPAASIGATRAQTTPGSDASLGFLSASDQPGSIGRLGSYEITREVGRGGMGIVLQGRDTRLDRVVAVKVLAPQLAVGAAARQRFLREAKAAAAVRDEHVVTIYAVEEAAGLPYLVMELIAGMSLQERIDRDASLEVNEILRIGIQTARGLAAAHALGLIHRDVKPANILLENGVERVKLTDFGLARVVDDASFTQSGIIAGTPHYMSPEQARGEAVDHRSDLFSLGSVLYAMCTGRPPFRAGNTVGVLKRICEDRPSPIREANPNIPEWLVQLIEKLHATEPAQRYQSASEVAALLSRQLAELAQPPSAGHALGREADARAKSALGNVAGTAKESQPPRRRWTLVAAALVILASGLGLSEATGVTQVVPTVIRIVTGEGTLVVETDPDVKVIIEGNGNLAFNLAGGQTIRVPTGPYRVKATKDGQPVPLESEMVTISRGGRAVVKVTHEAPSAAISRWEPPGPGVLDALDAANIPIEKRFSWQPNEVVQVIGSHRGGHWNEPTVVVYSPDGKLAASAGYDGHIYVWDPDTLDLTRILPARGQQVTIWDLAFLPDNRRLLSGGEDNVVRLWDVESGTEIRQFKGHSHYVWGIAVSPDGTRALSGAADGTVRLWDVESAHELHRFEGHSGWVLSVAFSPDGSKALSGGSDNTMRLWDLTAKEALHCFEGNTHHHCRRVRFLSDGRRAISVCHDSTVRLWNLETRQEVHKFKGHTHGVYSIDVTRDDARAITTGEDRTIRLWDVQTGAELLQLKSPTPFGFSSVALSPDGKKALSAGHDRALRLWDLDRAAEIEAGRAMPVSQCASRIGFSQDGRRLVTCMSNGFATVWDVASGRRLRTLTKVGSYMCGTLSPDGTRAICGGEWGVSEWNVETGQELRQFEGTRFVWDFAISRDGRSMITGDQVGSNGSVRLWEFDSGRELSPLGSHVGHVYAVALSMDGRRALSGGEDKYVRLWDLTSGSLLHQWQHTSAVWSVALSPDGRYVAAGDDSGYVQLRDLSGTMPKLVALPKVHSSHVRAVFFSPDSQTLASAGYDGRIILRDVASGEVRRTWQFPAWIATASYSPDGRHLATVNGNGTVYILRLATLDQPDSK